MMPGPADRGQPTSFAPGRTPRYPDSVFQATFDGARVTVRDPGHRIRLPAHPFAQERLIRRNSLPEPIDAALSRVGGFDARRIDVAKRRQIGRTDKRQVHGLVEPQAAQHIVHPTHPGLLWGQTTDGTGRESGGERVIVGQSGELLDEVGQPTSEETADRSHTGPDRGFARRSSR